MDSSLVQEINFETLQMRELYYANMVYFKDFENLIDAINKKYKLRKELALKGDETYYRGYKGKENIYNIPIKYHGE